MTGKRPALFKRRHFEAEIIVLCVRWYLRYPLSFRQLEESYRWTQRQIVT
jgi:transposase-like protein